MNTATFRDLSLANSQGTLVENPLSGYKDGSIEYMSALGNPMKKFVSEYIFLAFALLIFFYGIYKYQQAKRDITAMAQSNRASLKTPLVFA